MRGHGRKGVADRYLAAVGKSSPQHVVVDSKRSASASKSTRTRATEASSPFGTPQREEDACKSPLTPDLFAGPSRAPRREDPQVEDLRQYRRRRAGVEGGGSSAATSPWTSESPQSEKGRKLKRPSPRRRSQEQSPSSTPSNAVDESSIESASSKELSQRNQRRRPQSTLNQVVEKGLEFIFDSTACAPVPPASSSGKRTSAAPYSMRTSMTACAVPSQNATSTGDRRTYADWKRGGRRMTNLESPTPPQTQNQGLPSTKSSIHPLSPTQSDLTGVATEVMTNRAYDVAMKRIQKMNTGVQEAKQRIERERGDRYLYNTKEMKSLVSVSSNDESSVLRPPKGDRIGKASGTGTWNNPNMSFTSELSMTSSVDVNERIRDTVLQMPVLSEPAMQRKTYRMPPGSADLCLSPPSIVRNGSSRSIDQRSPDPIFSARSFSMLSPIRTPGSLDSFVSNDAMFMEQSDSNNMIDVPNLDHRMNTSRTEKPSDVAQSRQLEQKPRKKLAAIPMPELPETEPDITQEPKPSEKNSSTADTNDESQTSVAKAFLQAVARRRGGHQPTVSKPATEGKPKPTTVAKPAAPAGKPMTATAATPALFTSGKSTIGTVAKPKSATVAKPSIASKLNDPVDRGRKRHADNASVDVKSIRSIFESRGTTSGVDNVYDDDDDDTASVKSLKEIFEPSVNKDDQSVNSNISRLRAKFDAKKKIAPKGKFTDDNSVAKRSFSIFETRSKKDNGSVQQRFVKPKHARRLEDLPTRSQTADRKLFRDLEKPLSETSAQSPDPPFVGTVEDMESRANTRSGEYSIYSKDRTDRDEDDSHGNSRADSNAPHSSKRQGPPPMWMDHREIVLAKRFQIGSIDTFHKRSSNAVASSASRGVGTSISGSNRSNQTSSRDGTTWDAHSGRTAQHSTSHDEFVRGRSDEPSPAEKKTGLNSETASSTDRAQDDGYLPEKEATLFVRTKERDGTHNVSSNPGDRVTDQRFRSKSVSQSVDSSASSDYSDGVTLDASIMEVSVLTNPTELFSRGGKQRHCDSDESGSSRKDTNQTDQNEAAAKESEASSSQPSVSAVPLLAKIMKNFPQSDEFSAINSKHSRLKRVWSQSQYESKTEDGDDEAIDEAYGYDALDDTYDMGWDLHHVGTMLPKSEYVTDWEPFESSTAITGDKDRQKASAHIEKSAALSNSSETPPVTSPFANNKAEIAILPESKTIRSENNPIRSASADGDAGTGEKLVPSSRTANEPVSTRSHDHSVSAEINQPFTASRIQRSKWSDLRPTAVDYKAAPDSRQKLQNGPSEPPIANNGFNREFWGSRTFSQGRQQTRADSSGGHSKPGSSDPTPGSKRPSLKQVADLQLEKPLSNKKSDPLTPVQSYLKAWRKTLKETKSPLNNERSSSQREAEVDGATRTATDIHSFQVPSAGTKLIRQRSLHAEDTDPLKPSSNAQDSPRARDFEARSIRRLRMRQMIDLFETERFEHSSGVHSEVNVRKGEPRRHTLFPATSPSSQRALSRSEPGPPKSWRGESGSLSVRAAQALISQRNAKRFDGNKSPAVQHQTTPSGSKNMAKSVPITSPRTPRTRLIQRFRQQLTPGDLGDVSLSTIHGDKTPTRSNMSYQNDISDHSAAYDIMPYLLPDFEARKPTSRYASSIASSTTGSVVRSHAGPASLSSEIAGYTSASVGNSDVHAKSVVGTPGHPAYQPKYTALRNRLKTLRESRLRREHNKQEFMASPTGVIEAHPQSVRTSLFDNRSRMTVVRYDET